MSEQPLQFSDHTRNFSDLSYIYPVISRRAKGLSIGVNLNPDKVCNFDCPYCQVDRTTAPTLREVDEDVLFGEMESVIELAKSSELWQHPRFKSTPEHLREIRDFAFAGDGEPTSYKRFKSMIQRLVDVRAKFSLEKIPINILTNATLFHLPHVKDGLELLERTASSLWVKLDAGTQEYFELVNASRFSLEHCLKNMLEVAKRRSIEIQSMFFKYESAPPSKEEIRAYVERLKWLVDEGATIARVQVYTIARMPSDSACTPLSEAELHEIADPVLQALPELNIETFTGSLD